MTRFGAIHVIVVALASACPAPPPAAPTPVTSFEGVELVESHPIETTLDHADIPDAYEVWPAMLAQATRSIDVAEFYASNAPDSRLEPVVKALEAAVARGVRVRYLGETSFVRVYHDTIDRLQRAGVQLRMLDLSGSTGGILHAKYFIVDGNAAFLGSQNFDWRALQHIQELGVRVRDLQLVGSLATIFEHDWARAGAERVPIEKPIGATGPITFVASPKDLLPPGIAWDLPSLVALIDGARQRIRIQLLTYRADDDGKPWTELEAPLLAAAARGVRVELLLADWSKRAKTLPGLQRLARVPNVEIRLVTIPAWSGGFIPFARVIHAKLLAVDGARAWLGTSNWEREYFHESRNVGLVIEEPALAARIDRFIDDTWRSPYAMRLDPDARYEPPKIE